MRRWIIMIDLILTIILTTTVTMMYESTLSNVLTVFTTFSNATMVVSALAGIRLIINITLVSKLKE